MAVKKLLGLAEPPDPSFHPKATGSGWAARSWLGSRTQHYWIPLESQTQVFFQKLLSQVRQPDPPLLGPTRQYDPKLLGGLNCLFFFLSSLLYIYIFSFFFLYTFFEKKYYFLFFTLEIFITLYLAYLYNLFGSYLCSFVTFPLFSLHFNKNK